jgi:hypothetical protein
MLLVFKYYSNWMTVLNFFPMTHTVNTALYLTNWCCFFGNFYLMFYNPKHIPFLTRDLPWLSTLPPAVTHVLNNLWHVLPLYLFRNRQTLKETIAISSVLLSALFFFVYAVGMPESDIVKLYDVTKEQLLVMGVAMGPAVIVFLWAVHRLMRSKK